VKTEEHKVRRVVAALDVAATPEQVLEAAAGLATALHAELVGLFVEDQRLLRVAELPFAQELSLTTARAQRLVVGQVERALQRQAERMRRMIGDLAQPLGLAWTLEVVRGDSLQTALAYAGADDLLVIGRARYLPGAFGRTASLAGQSARARPVAVLFDGTPQAERALGFAATLAGAADGEVAVLVPAPGPEIFRARRLEAAHVLQARGASAITYAMLPDAGAVSVERASRERRAWVLVWPAGERRAAAGAVAKLLADVTCPVVMIG
jgi:nucleotide-binding universal stress UspA family protein